jgi:hypothetical protein
MRVLCWVRDGDEAFAARAVQSARECFPGCRTVRRNAAAFSPLPSQYESADAVIVGAEFTAIIEMYRNRGVPVVIPDLPSLLSEPVSIAELEAVETALAEAPPPTEQAQAPQDDPPKQVTSDATPVRTRNRRRAG